VFSVESVKTIPEKIKEGTNVQLLITVKNVGSKEAEAVSLRAYKESSQPFEFDEKSDFVGKLKPGETGEAVLKFSVDKSATVKTHILDLEIRGVYNDEVITDDAIATIRVENGEKKGLFGSGASLIIGLVIVLVVVGVGLLIYFKRKRE
ncbi:MAG: hypothetical protein KAQ85_08350, partial [Thermodesulfovibrionia bacterium]|nr:hypothetical protein [Thermodesulfovibrionia bacterium]